MNLRGSVARACSLGLGVLAGTAQLGVLCRVRGVSTGGRVSNSLRIPRLVTDGSAHLGERAAFRIRRMRSDVGAAGGARLFIGARTFTNEGCTTIATRAITIGQSCRIGDFIAVFDSHYHAVGPGDAAEQAAVSVSHNVWITRGALVMPGVSIGDNSVVAAQSVVAHDVPADRVVGASPARLLRELPDVGAWRRG